MTTFKFILISTWILSIGNVSAQECEISLFLEKSKITPSVMEFKQCKEMADRVFCYDSPLYANSDIRLRDEIGANIYTQCSKYINYSSEMFETIKKMHDDLNRNVEFCHTNLIPPRCQCLNYIHEYENNVKPKLKLLQDQMATLIKQRDHFEISNIILKTENEKLKDIDIDRQGNASLLESEVRRLRSDCTSNKQGMIEAYTRLSNLTEDIRICFDSLNTCNEKLYENSELYETCMENVTNGRDVRDIDINSCEQKLDVVSNRLYNIVLPSVRTAEIQHYDVKARDYVHKCLMHNDRSELLVYKISPYVSITSYVSPYGSNDRLPLNLPVLMPELYFANLCEDLCDRLRSLSYTPSYFDYNLTDEISHIERLRPPTGLSLGVTGVTRFIKWDSSIYAGYYEVHPFGNNGNYKFFMMKLHKSLYDMCLCPVNKDEVTSDDMAKYMLKEEFYSYNNVTGTQRQYAASKGYQYGWKLQPNYNHKYWRSYNVIRQQQNTNN